MESDINSVDSYTGMSGSLTVNNTKVTIIDCPNCDNKITMQGWGCHKIKCGICNFVTVGCSG